MTGSEEEGYAVTPQHFDLEATVVPPEKPDPEPGAPGQPGDPATPGKDEPKPSTPAPSGEKNGAPASPRGGSERTSRPGRAALPRTGDASQAGIAFAALSGSAALAAGVLAARRARRRG